MHTVKVSKFINYAHIVTSGFAANMLMHESLLNIYVHNNDIGNVLLCWLTIVKYSRGKQNGNTPFLLFPAS